MVTVSGFTTSGIIRKRMADLYSDFALRIKESGVFGTQTTVDAPDLFPADPLVQIMATTAGSLHELWEAVELWFSQLDPRTASGTYLEFLHGSHMVFQMLVSTKRDAVPIRRDFMFDAERGALNI